MNEHIRVCMRRNYMLVCAVRVIGAYARVHSAQDAPFGALALPADTPMADSSTMMHLPRDAHGGRPHARISGDTIVIIRYIAHYDTYQRNLEYHLDRRRVE